MSPLTFIAIELAVIIALLAFFAARKSGGAASTPPIPEPNIEPKYVAVESAAGEPKHSNIVILKGDSHYCESPPGHHDLPEFLATPGFYLKHPDGSIEAGEQ